MKKQICALLSAACLLSAPAFAANEQYELKNNREADEIMSLKSEICEWVNDMLESDTNESPIDEEDIDFSRAYRIDVDCSVMKQEDVSLTGTDRHLKENNTYLWELPVDAGKHTVVVAFTLGRPPRDGIENTLTEEEYQQLLADVGHWGVSSAGLLDKGQDIPSRAWAQVKELDLSEPVQVRYVGGESEIHTAMAIVYEGEKPVKLIPLVGEFSIRTERTKTPMETVYQVDNSYDFNTVRELVKIAEPESGNGGTTLVIKAEQKKAPIVLVILIAAAALGAAAVLLRRRKKA